MQVVMMVAGKSTRTYPLTLTCPKPLLKIVNKPIIEYNLEQLEGIADEVILIVGYRHEMIREHLGGQFGKIKLIYQEQREQRGTGHAILQAKPWIKGPFIAMNGDDLFARQDMKRLLKYSFAALVKEVPDPSLYGVYELDEKGRVVNLIEKPTNPIGNLANIGCYLFQPSIFDEIERTPVSERGEIEITSAVASIAKREEFYVVPIKGYWLPTGYAWHLLDHQEYFLSRLEKSSILGEVEKGVTIHGAVRIGKGTIVKAGTYIEGPVVIGEDCQIGPNCYLRKYTTIGHRCRIGQGVEIKNSIVMDEVNICHLSYVGDSVIGNRVNLGAGTIVANRRHDNQNVLSMIKGKLIDTGRTKLGTIIGDEVQTGIYTAIYPGRKIWPGKCTRPGEIVSRDLI